MAQVMASTSKFSPEYLAANHSKKLIDVAIIFMVLETLFFALFLVARFKNKTLKCMDVYFMIPAYAFCFSLTIMALLHVIYSDDGRHKEVVSSKRIVVWFKIQFAGVILYSAAVALPKLSIICLYLRVFTSRRYRMATYIVGVTIVLQWVVAWIVLFTMCRPFAFNWDKKIRGGKCLNQWAIYSWFGLPNILTDVAMLLLPLQTIWKLQISRNQKIGLSITFLTGSMGLITACMRFASFFEFDLFDDFTWNSVYAMTWGNAEPGVYLIAACLLSLRPLFVSIFKRVKSIRSPPAADSSSSYRLSAYPGSPSERSDSAFGGTIASPPAKFSHRESKASDQEPIIAPSRRFSQVGMMHTDQDPVLTPKKFRGKTTITISASPPKIGEGIRKDGDGMGIVVTTTYGYESCLASEIDWENI